MTNTEIFKVIPCDTTLRDGAQTPGMTSSLSEKEQIAEEIARFGIPYFEGGQPYANPEEMEFFLRAKKLRLGESKLIAFGSTFKVNDTPENSDIMRVLLDCETEVVAIYGKSSLLHVTKTLRTTGARNLEMISQSIAHLAKHRRVFYDAEHFFDGYKEKPDYALETLQAAKKNGAEVIILCDTNGGSLPEFIYEATLAAKKCLGADFPLGIHAHNDDDSAKENSIQAVRAGAVMVQGTINRSGERCGNLDLCVFLASVKLKRGWDIGNIDLRKLRELSSFVELKNGLSVPGYTAYTGLNAFCDTAGGHVDAGRKLSGAYHHIDPKLVGGEVTISHSSLGGKANVEAMAEKHGFSVKPSSEEQRELVRGMKELQILGDAQESLLLRRVLLGTSEPFDVLPDCYSLSWHDGKALAHVSVRINGDILEEKAEGKGQINAFDIGLRHALVRKFPEVSEVRLLHYNIPDIQQPGTDAEVVIHTVFGADGIRWTSIAKGANQQTAGEHAIIDGYKYYINLVLGEGKT